MLLRLSSVNLRLLSSKICVARFLNASVNCFSMFWSSTLYTIKSLWRQEDQTKNALEIAKKSGALYDKFVNFIESLQKIGEHIDKSKEMYEKAYNQLKNGKGNLISQAENIKKMGAITKKSLPKDILDE